MLRIVQIDGRPGDTARYVCSDTATPLPAAVLTNSGAECLGLLITVESYAVRIAFNNIHPTQGVAAIGHVLNAGDVLRVFGNDLASTFHYINANNAQNAVLQITPYYT
jgi:hypothetical protein